MSDDFLINLALGSLAPSGIIVLSVAWILIRTGHHLIWPVAVILLCIVVWFGKIVGLPVVMHGASPEAFLLSQQLAGLLLPLLVAFVAIKQWPRSNSSATDRSF